MLDQKTYTRELQGKPQGVRVPLWIQDFTPDLSTHSTRPLSDTRNKYIAAEKVCSDKCQNWVGP